VEPEGQGTRVAGAEPLAHDPRPQAARRPELRDLLEQVVVRVEEERELRRELVHAEPRPPPPARTHAFASVKATSCTAVLPASRMW